MQRLARPLDDIRDHYDVVIVGSGYGGGVAASRLARAGKRVAVLERGREVLPGEFPSRFPDLRTEMRVESRSMRLGSPTGLYDVRLGDDIHVLVGRGLGGGSLINAGVALRPDDRVFADAVWPDQIRQDGLLAEGYRRAEAWLRPGTSRKSAEFRKLSVLRHAADALGHGAVEVRTTISHAAGINAAGIAQEECTACGDCCSGCNVGAKTTVAATYLADAARNGAQLFTHARVRRVLPAGVGGEGWRVEIERVGGENDGAVVIITGAIVILAAGTLGSTEVLLRSAEAGLSVSDRLGQRFSANGDIIAFGYGGREVVNGIGVGHPAKLDDFIVGPAVSGQLEVRNADDLAHEIRLQDGALPSSLAPMLPVLFVPNGRIVGALKSLVSGVYRGPFRNLQTFFAVSHDEAAGSIGLATDGRLAVSWPGAKDLEVYKRLDELLTAVVKDNGGSYVKNPLSGTLMGPVPATAHPLGGCTMARDRQSGVVDHKGQVFKGGAGTGGVDVHPGLYVIDGSVVPRSLGVNPLLTITAIAERALMHMAADRGFTADAEPVAA